METVNSNSATLSNFEVMTLLQKIKDGSKKQKGQLATITYETLRYLESSPCKQQTSRSITNCLKAVEPFSLTKNEKLMIINSPPSSPLEVQLIVEESEERLSEEEVEQLIQVVLEHHPQLQKEAIVK